MAEPTHPPPAGEPNPPADAPPNPPAGAPRSPAATVAAAWREGRLAYPAAPDGTPVWPPRAHVPGTGEPVRWEESRGRGTVYAATALHARDAEPRSLALIDLDEGFRMMSRVEGLPAAEVRAGMRVRVQFTPPDHDGERLPVFVLWEALGP